VTFFATDLAVDAWLKRVVPTAATVASTAGESSTVAAATVATATVATSAPSAAEITPATLALGGEVHGRLAASIVHLQALLVGDQLGVKLGDGDGLDACCYGRHDINHNPDPTLSARRTRIPHPRIFDLLLPSQLPSF
jgi:hypothetical protein